MYARTCLIAMTGLVGMCLSSFVSAQSDPDYRLPQCKQPIASVAIGAFSCSSMNCKPMGGMSALSSLTSMMGAPKLMDYSVAAASMPAKLAQSLRSTGCFVVVTDAGTSDFLVTADIGKINITSQTVLFRKTESTTAMMDIKIVTNGQGANLKQVISSSESSAMSLKAGRFALSNDVQGGEKPSDGEVVVADLLAQATSHVANWVAGQRPVQ